jgi:NTE family protein
MNNTAGEHKFQLVPVLAGGGTRLPAHVGVLNALQELGVHYDKIVGVSGGSIVAALHAAGWSTSRMRDLAMDVPYQRFRGFSLYQLLFHGGLTSGNGFEQWLDDLLEGVRFKDLPMELAVVATDVKRCQPVIFDRHVTPDYPVSKAVRHSMGIPLLFAFQQYGDAVLVDGSILSEDALQRDWAGDGTPVCVFRLRGDDAGAPIAKGWFPLPSYLHMLVRTFMTTVSREFVDIRHWPRTVVVDVGPRSPVDFKMTREDKEDLYKRGYDTARSIMPFKFPALAAWIAAEAASATARESASAAL